MNHPRSERSRWIGRICLYLFGVAIGFVLLGFYWQGRQAWIQKRQQQQQQHVHPEGPDGESR